MRVVRRSLLLGLTATLLAAAPAGASGGRLVASGSGPFTFKGSGFRAGEHVRLVARMGSRAPVVRKVVATHRGSFVIRDVAVGKPGPCEYLTAQATGSRGTHAALMGTMHPNCAVR